MVDVSRVSVSGPLQPFATGFSTELARLGYTKLSARVQMHLFAHASRWLCEQGRSATDLPDEVSRFLDARRAAGYTSHLTYRSMRPMVTYLCDLGVATAPQGAATNGPVEQVLDRYQQYLAAERGLGAATIRGYVAAVRPFLERRLSANQGIGLALDHLTAAEVSAFVVAQCRGRAPGGAKRMVTTLRALLRFLHVEGAMERPLTAAVPSVARWRLAGLPKGLELGQVRKLLSSCDRRTSNGLRDFAVLTVLVRLGLRAGDVAGLRLDDIDWRAGEIVVRGKADRAERLPLPADVGEAVAAYLRRSRPPGAQGRTVFVRLKAPHRHLTGGGVTQLVAAAAHRAGLGLIHAHRLRHTAATLMLRGGASLAEIGQVLRHRRALTTAIYAKVDRLALRAIARPWPGGVA
jgi:integrase/recombinase XerD